MLHLTSPHLTSVPCNKLRPTTHFCSKTVHKNAKSPSICSLSYMGFGIYGDVQCITNLHTAFCTPLEIKCLPWLRQCHHSLLCSFLCNLLRLTLPPCSTPIFNLSFLNSSTPSFRVASLLLRFQWPKPRSKLPNKHAAVGWSFGQGCETYGQWPKLRCKVV